MATKGARAKEGQMIAASNPAADLNQAMETLRLMEQLSEAGLPERGYDLESPYGHATVHQSDEVAWSD